VDRPTHPELHDDAGPDATDLVAGDGIAGGATQAGDFHLDRIGIIERERETRIGKCAAGHHPPVIAPLLPGQSLQRPRYRRRRHWSR
jgi:hypothetical protein